MLFFQIKLWHIKDEGFSDHLEDWLAELRGHRRRVTQVCYIYINPKMGCHS